MRGILTFLFGTGWWTLWHLALLAWLVPSGLLLAYFKGFKPGKGPQGGEVMLMLLIFVVTVLVTISLVDALLWARSLPVPGIGKYGKAAAIWLAGSIVWIVLIFWFVELATSLSGSAALRGAGVIALGVTFAALFALNLAALSRFHQAKRMGQSETQQNRQEIRRGAAQSVGEGTTGK